MSENNLSFPIIFCAEKVYVHHWPLNSPTWSKSAQENLDSKLNKNKEKKRVKIENHLVKIDDFGFEEIKKVGITVPLFKKQTTLVFEGKFENVFAHIHITTSSQNYLKIFNNLMSWKNQFFQDSV